MLNAFFIDPPKKVDVWPVLALFAVITSLLFLGQAAQELLRYSRPDILQGQWWRLLSGHLVHLNKMHGFMNLGALLLTIFIVGRQLSTLQWWLSGLAIALFISFGLWFISVDVEWYVGFSGVLHGLLGLGLLVSAVRGDRLHAITFVGLLIKVVYEQLPGFDANHLHDVINAAVVVDAHLYGFIAGVLLAVGYQFRALSDNFMRLFNRA